MLAMFHVRQYLTFGRSIPAELIGDQHARHRVTLFQELPKEREGSSFVAPALHQDIEHVAILINRTPEIVQLAVD
jgi:hypothetical protein